MDHEVIARSAEASFAHKKVFAGGGQFAKVVLRLEPLPAGAGLQIVNRVADDVIPARFVEGIREGVHEASKRGVLAGSPVTDVRVIIIDGTYHEIDSDRQAFRLAARCAFWAAMRKAEPRIQSR